jgi:hypothetical protein
MTNHQKLQYLKNRYGNDPIAREALDMAEKFYHI